MFYENRLVIKKCVISLFTFCPNTGTKFRAPYHSNHVIPTVYVLSTEQMKESENGGRRGGGGGGRWRVWVREGAGNVSSSTIPTPNQPLFISISLSFNVMHSK